MRIGAYQLLTASRDPCNASERNAALVLESGLQEFLTILVAALSSAVAESRRVPSGLSGRFEAALSNPTLGGLREFVFWLSSDGSTLGPAQLQAYLQAEKRGGGWLSQLVDLRNRWAHPRDETPQDVVGRVARLLPEMPETLRGMAIEIEDSGRPYFHDGEARVQLDPFAWVDADDVVVFSTFEAPARLHFRLDNPEVLRRFQSLWFDLRVADRALTAPTSEEFREKCRRSSYEIVGPAPWWLDRLREPGPPAFLVEPGAADGALASLGTTWPDAVAAVLPLEDGASVPAALAATIGLASPPKAAELVALVPSSSPCALQVRAASVPTRTFLDLLYWLADVREAGGAPGLRVIVERSSDRLTSEGAKLNDRLPERIEELLRRPTRASNTGLQGFVWPPVRPKRLFGFS